MTQATQAKKVVLVTGGNSGIGFHACLHIAKQDNYHLLLTGRNPERVQKAVEKVRAVASASSIVEGGILDLGNLASIETYCKHLVTRPDISEIATLICNAGVQLPTNQITHDGVEMTFGVNHLGHFYLATLLREYTRRLIVVTSGTHDAAEHTPAPPPNVSNLEKLAFGYEPFNGVEAYTTSKLCNMLFMFEWLRRFPIGIECIAYTPGLTPDTTLSRDMNYDFTSAIAASKAKGVPISTSETSGTFMGRLAIENWTENGWASGQYIRVHEVYEPSVQAKDPVLASALWDKSTELIKRLTAAK